jgi:P4 family phage/plasmid primase-like protien
METDARALSPSMSITNNKSSLKYRDVQDFLAKHIVQKGVQTTTPKPIITNTRIGDKKGISGGSYHIPDSEYPIFLELYHRDVIAPKKKEYLTEKQLDTPDSPILVDLDFRHEYDIVDRQYTQDHIDDMIVAYLDELKLIFQLDETTRFPIYLFEKDTVNRMEDKKITKDGIHMIIGLKADRTTQMILRKRMIARIAEMWSDLPITNTWEDVFDEGISAGYTNWQLYGSRKPNYEQYKLTRVFDIQYDESDGELMSPTIPLSTFDIGKNICKLSVRYKDHPSLFMKSDFVSVYEEYNRVNRVGGRNSTAVVATAGNAIVNESQMIDFSDKTGVLNIVMRIRNADELEKIINMFKDWITPQEYGLRETYDFAMILPPSYYEAGSYSKWIRVCWALKNISTKLLPVWIAFSARASGFQYSSIPDLCERWRNTDLRAKNGLTKRSLIHWARTDAPEEYEKVRSNSIDYYLEQTISTRKNGSNKADDKVGCGDFDIANVLYQCFKHEFVCASIKSNIWYQYKNHRWVEIDSGTTLRKAISVQLRDLYQQKSLASFDDANTQQEELSDNAKFRVSRILNICMRLANTTDKQKIMLEAKELFYDDKFIENLDANPNLLCFRNGVIDFKNKVFRPGHPEDNISMTTGIDYIRLDPAIHGKTMDEINDFMNKLFPNPIDNHDLCRYMWDHLASTMMGTTANQVFNMYIGGGQNGKSVLVNLMEMVLGSYKGDVPLSLVTDKRGKIGGLAPEVVQLKGTRYAVMQEPSKGDVINEGVMKQLTSGKDQLQGRAPYMTKMISFLPQFKLAVTCNALMGIKANDHGTWRRIRAVPFEALFTENPVNDDPSKPYQYKLDKYIDEKFDSWKEVFASMLAARAFQTNGEVKDCAVVMNRSNEYRQSQDIISEYIRDRLILDATGSIKKMELNNDFSMWYMSNYGGRGPSPKDLHEYMDKDYGRPKAQKWMGVRIRYEQDQEQSAGQTHDDDDYTDEIELNEL